MNESRPLFRRGYFLIEALLAAVILGTTVVALIDSLQAGMIAARSSKQQFQAINLAEGALEELRGIWAARPDSSNPTLTPFDGQWVTLSPTTQPPLRDPGFQVRYRIASHTSWAGLTGQALTWSSPPAPPIPADRLYVIEVEAISPDGEGATLTTLLGKRGS